jgi:hypothetical protein
VPEVKIISCSFLAPMNRATCERTVFESLRCRFGEGIESPSDIGRKRFLVFSLGGDDLLRLGTGRARVQIDQALDAGRRGETGV